MKKIITMSLFALLQMFAYDPQAQPANGTYSEALKDENKVYYDKQLIRYALPNLVHQQFGQERDLPGNGGKTIEFRNFASLGKALTPLTEGVTPDAQSLEVSAVTATIHQYGGFVALTDMIDMTAIDPVVTETVQLIGDQAGLTLDTIVRDIINTGTNAGYAYTYSDGTPNKVYYRHQLDDTAVLTVKVLEEQYTELKSQNAPKIDGYYICIAHPKATHDLKQDPNWREPQQYTANVRKIFENEVGEIAGFRIIETTEAKIFKGDDLSADSRELTVSSVSGKTVTVSEALTANSLKDRFVLIGGERYEVASNTSTTFTLKENVSGISAGTKVYPGEGGAEGRAVFSCLCFGKNAYGKTKIDGENLRTIIKPRGSGGTSDPLEQRSTIGWKAALTAEILIPQYLRRLEVGGTYATPTLAAN